MTKEARLAISDEIRSLFLLLEENYNNYNKQTDLFILFSDKINGIAEEIKKELGFNYFINKVSVSADAINYCKIMFSHEEIRKQANKKAAQLYEYTKTKNDFEYLLATFLFCYAMKAYVTNEIKINVKDETKNLKIVN